MAIADEPAQALLAHSTSRDGSNRRRRNERRLHLVQCANLMPEAVAVIRDLIGIAAVLDHGADNAVTRAKQLLAKLEGGAEDAVETQS